MTYEEFIKELTEASAHLIWSETPSGHIRTRHGWDEYYCPITAVYAAISEKYAHPMNAYHAGIGFLGLTEKTYKSIMRASDTDVDSEVKKDLRKATGLQGTKH